MKIEINKGELRACMIFAFRYALGRMSMDPYTITQIIKDNEPVLTNFDREQMINDIQNAIDLGGAGMACDIKLWKEFADYLRVDKLIKEQGDESKLQR